MRFKTDRIVRAWASFDFANSSFSVIMVTFVFPLYYQKVIAQNAPHADTMWANTMSASMLLVALVTPLLGAMADILRNKKLYLGIFTSLAVLCTASEFFVPAGAIWLASILFILANTGFEGGTVFYDAFLPEITTPETYGRVSGFGFAIGYLGSLAALILFVVLYLVLELPTEVTFLATASMFALFALPMFFIVPEKRRASTVSFGAVVRKGFGELRKTIGHIRQYRNVARFLLAFFLYNDAILTIIAFSSTYADHVLHFSMTELAGFFAMIQIIASVGSIVFGRLADRRGPKFTVVITLAIWIVVTVLAYFAVSKGLFWGVGALAGIALGSSQSVSRSLMARLTPKEHTTEFFAFYDGFCGKASAIIGPLVFGQLSLIFGSERPAIIALTAFFIAGLLLLRSVKVDPIVVQEAPLQMATV